MFKVLKTIIIIILVFLLFFAYLFYTDSGKKLSFNILNFIVTQKIGLHTKVVELDLENYPYMKTELLIEKKYKLIIDGYYENKKFDLKYTLNSSCIQTDVCKINDDVDINGTITGHRKALLIKGAGNILDGNVSYVTTKHRRSFNNLHMAISDINSTNLFKLLGQQAIFEGSANGYIDFDILSHEERRGVLYYTVKDKDYHGLEVDVETQIEIKDEHHTFNMKVKTPTARVNLLQGEYNKENRKASAIYQIDVENVTDLKKLLKVNYDAPFYATGILNYDDKTISMQGFSKSLGGMLDLILEDNKLHFYLSNSPASTLMEKFDVDPILDTNITGHGIYQIKQKTITFDATLSKFQFKDSKLTQSLFKSSQIDLSKEIFHDNHLQVRGEDGEISTSLTVKNKDNHLTFNDIEVNSDNNSIQSFVDLHMYKYFLKGALYLKMDKYTSSNDTYINFDGTMQKHYAITLKGLVNKKWTSMDYSISSARLPSHVCTIVDDVNVSGHVNGPFTRLTVEGEGKALNGHIKFEGLKSDETLKNVMIEMHDIHAQKLSTLLGYPDLPFGKVDLEANFDLLNSQTQKGNIHYILRKSKLFDLPFDLDARVKVDNKNEKFNADITLAGAKINLTKGNANLTTNQTEAFYSVDVKDLTRLEKLLGYPYQGPFYAIGKVNYDGNYTIHGLSKTFNGLTEFNYENDILAIDLSNVSFKNILGLSTYPKVLDAETTGTIKYDFTEENLTVKTKLKNARFSYIEEMDILYQKAGINLLKEQFTDSSLTIDYHGKDVLVNLIMNSDTSHLSFTNTLIDTELNSVNAYFDVKMQGKEFTGKVYGSLDSPKINLNMQKLIRHEMDRQLDSFVGKGNRKMMESMPMGNVAKDVASGMGGAFMGIFF